MKTRRVATVVFCDDDGKIAIQDRTGYKTEEEEYGFFGGGIEENESPEAALTREVHEELDLNIKNFEFVGEFSGGNSNFNVTMYFFMFRLNDLSKLKTKEGRGIKIIKPEDLEALPMGGVWDKKAIREFIKKIKLSQ